MYKIFFFVFLFSCVGIFAGCNKKVVSNENVLYGTWIKGSNAGDTLQFSQKNGKNILTYNLSFNADFPASAEAEYIYQNGMLSLKTTCLPLVIFFYYIASSGYSRARNLSYRVMNYFPLCLTPLYILTIIKSHDFPASQCLRKLNLF